MAQSTDGTAKDFFDTVDKAAQAKLEEERLMSHIQKSKSVKEAETLAWLSEPPKHGTGHSPRGGKEIVVQWKDAGGAIIKQAKTKTDHVYRLPLDELCKSWSIKNIRYFEGAIVLKTMMDGYSDLPLHNKNADTVGILADPMTDEDKEAFNKAEKERNRRPSGGPAPARKLSGASGGNAPAQAPRKLSGAAPAAAPRKLSGASGNEPAQAPRKLSGNPAPSPTVTVDTPMSPPKFHLTEEDRKARDQAEEAALWKKVGGRPKDQ